MNSNHLHNSLDLNTFGLLHFSLSSVIFLWLRWYFTSQFCKFEVIILETLMKLKILFVHLMFLYLALVFRLWMCSLITLLCQVDNAAAVLGFVGAPFTLASYVVEGGSSKHFSKIKRLAFSQPKVMQNYVSLALWDLSIVQDSGNRF